MFQLKRKKDNAGKRGFILGSVVGAALGAATGILFAPNSGKETRRQLVQGTKDLSAELTKRIDQLEKTGNKEAKELIKKAEIAKKNLANKAQELIEDSKDLSDAAVAETKKMIAESSALVDQLGQAAKAMANTANNEAKKFKK